MGSKRILVCLVCEENEYEPHRRRADADVCRPVEGFPTHACGVVEGNARPVAL
jgi:hypothetical protein